MTKQTLTSINGSLDARDVQRSVPVGLLTLLQEAAREVGADADALLHAVGVEPSELKHPMSPIPLHVLGRALLRGRQLAGCEHFAALAGARAKFGNSGLIALLVMQERLVRDAVADLARFLGIWYRGVHFSLDVTNNWARFVILLADHIEGRAEISTFFAAAMNRHLQTIIGDSGWKGTRVTLEQPKPGDVRPYRQVFKALVTFGESQAAIEFPAAALDITRETTEEHLNDLLRKHLMGLESKGTLTEEVRRLIELMLPRGDCTIERVAQLFSMHRKTLHRHLAAQGTTFKTELEDVRRASAERMLAERHMPVGEVALALGYKDPVNFSRAFRVWHGMPPTTWQRTLGRVA